MRRQHQVFLALLIVMFIALLPTAVALGQGQSFQLPHTFIGEAGSVTINGNTPNRDDLTLTAKVVGVDGITRPYSIPILGDGSFGGMGFYDLKLNVGGDGNEITEDVPVNIEFFVTLGGADFGAIASVQFQSGGQNVFKPGELNLPQPLPTPTPVPNPTPNPTPTPAPTSTPTNGGGNGNGGGGGGGVISTSTPRPATPTVPPGTGGQVIPTATPVPQLATSAPTPTIVVEPPGGLPTATPVAATTSPPTATVVPTPTSEGTEVGGGGENGGFPWWGWTLIILGAASAIGGAAFYYLRFQRA